MSPNPKSKHGLVMCPNCHGQGEEKGLSQWLVCGHCHGLGGIDAISREPVDDGEIIRRLRGRIRRLEADNQQLKRINAAGPVDKERYKTDHFYRQSRANL